MDFNTILQILDSTLRLTPPLLLACLAGLYSERAGVFDIGLEGKMLVAAFFAGAVAAVSGYAWVGLAAAIAASTVIALLHGFASITLRGNQLISGVAINFLAAGGTALIGLNWFRQGTQTPQLNGSARFSEITLPFADSIHSIPYLGPIYADLLSGHWIISYIAFLAVPFTWWLLFHTRFGLRLRAVCENPEAVDTAGISVIWMRYRAVIITGILCGIAGAYLSTCMNAGFVNNITAGKGFIALAALIFAKWKPWSAMWACLLFGFLEAISIRFPNLEIPGIGTIPVQFMQALPYILTVVILAGFVGKAIPPKAGGEAYVKER